MLLVSGCPDGHRQLKVPASDGVTIPLREWWKGDARAAVVYLHGQGDHSGPFTAMGDLLHEQGYAVFAPDHRGFGLSEEKRGHIDSYEIFIDDALTVLQHAGQRNPGRPVFLAGLSMGGHIALRTAVRAGDVLTGVIALSPGFRLRRRPSWAQVAQCAWLGLVEPMRYLPAVTDQVQTTKNQWHVDQALQDESFVRRYTARFYLEAVKSIRKARRELRRLTVPALVLMAGEDHLVCPETARRFFDGAGCADKEFRLLEGMLHNLVVEPEMPEVVREVTHWMETRMGPAGAERTG